MGSPTYQSRLNNSMRTITHISILCIGLFLLGCAPVDTGKLHRNCSIGLINVPVDNLAGLKVTADSFEIGISALWSGGQSCGDGETVTEWWLAMDAPRSIEFQLKFKDGSSITKQKTIETSCFNRFGIRGVYLINRNGTYSIETRYGVVLEYDGTHSSYINGWYFGDDGSLERLSHDQHLQVGQIGLGLMTNELLTNAIKHGRPDDGPLRVSVAFGSGERGLSLTVRDDGNGFPGLEEGRSVRIEEAAILHTGKLGLTLLDLMASQLCGEGSYRRDAGWTEFRLDFPDA